MWQTDKTWIVQGTNDQVNQRADPPHWQMLSDGAVDWRTAQAVSLAHEDQYRVRRIVDRRQMAL